MAAVHPALPIETNIRTTSVTKRIRPSEFFLDYDRLRSGFVTLTQFNRVLWENLNIKLTDVEQAQLVQKYDLKGDGRINYRLFCDTINQPFNPNNMNINPSQQTLAPAEFLGTTRSLQPLSVNKEQHIEGLLCRLAEYYKYRGINLRTCCEDFDRHHIGVIQQSQFYRSFPRPPDVKEEDVHLLVTKYSDPSRNGLLNYLNLHHDIVALGQRISEESISALDLPPSRDIASMLPPQAGADTTLQGIFDRIRVAVYKNRVRTIEFFKDYDKLRSGVITDNQFVCGLSLAIGKEAQLSRGDIQKVVEFYKADDGRVRYKEFCDMMENAFNIPDLEKKPTLDVVRPPEGALGRNLPVLSVEEEARVGEVLAQLADQVRKRRLMMYQYFTDYDRSKGYSRVITPTQFGRVLHFLSLQVAPQDLKLLCHKFADQSTGDVNYPAFVQCVDSEFVNYTQESMSEKKEQPVAKETILVEPEPISLDDLMARIRHHALTNRLRVMEFFEDFDPLRSGAITKSQFRRCLSNMGLSAIGQHNLTESQFQQLCLHYQCPAMHDKVMWFDFKDDVESVFTQANLEKYPTHEVHAQEKFLVPKPGTMDWEYAGEAHRNLLDAVMERLSQRTKQRRILTKPVFQDFDRHNNGHVTRGQFRQCLTMLELSLTEAEMSALEAKFCNDTGFNYLSFLSELEPQDPAKMMYVERLKELRMVNEVKPQPKAMDVPTDLESILTKIKTKVFKERMRVLEFLRDYDKLRSGRVRKSNFRRALDLCTFELPESSISILEDYYCAPGYPDFVDYVSFSDDVESIFTIKNLEKAPLLEVEQFRPPVEWEQNQLPAEMEQLLDQSIAKLAEKVRKTRMQLFPLFEDYDRVHNGTVSRSQFRRVLSELELAQLVASEQEWTCLWEKFDVKVGGKDDVNYIAFCDMIYNLAKFEWRKP